MLYNLKKLAKPIKIRRHIYVDVPFFYKNMHRLIEQLFKKRGIVDATDLTSEEKSNFEAWQGALTKEILTPEDIKEFLRAQILIIESKWQDLMIDNAKKSELIPYHTVYSLLLRVIDAPLETKKQTEQLLENLINNQGE